MEKPNASGSPGFRCTIVLATICFGSTNPITNTCPKIAFDSGRLCSTTIIGRYRYDCNAFQTEFKTQKSVVEGGEFPLISRRRDETKKKQTNTIYTYNTCTNDDFAIRTDKYTRGTIILCYYAPGSRENHLGRWRGRRVIILVHVMTTTSRYVENRTTRPIKKN